MQSLPTSIQAYENDLRARLGDLLVEEDLQEKHQKMGEDPFQFLRATCWRWAEAAKELCPEIFDGVVVPSVGDAHAGNFGLWRDAEARLAWGVNDFDEAALLPYGLDLVRLCASISLAGSPLPDSEIAGAALEAYGAALAAPLPFVLERDNLWLREAFASTNKKRIAFWRGLGDAPRVDPPAPVRDRLLADLPDALQPTRFAHRSAGVGSLGRPRFVAFQDYRGGPAAVEAKARMPSCWGAAGAPGLAQQIVTSEMRSADPMLHHDADYVFRRLAPNSGKIDFAETRPKLQKDLIRAMAAELAGIHCSIEPLGPRVVNDLRTRPKDWLAAAMKAVIHWTRSEFESYRKMGQDPRLRSD